MTAEVVLPFDLDFAPARMLRAGDLTCLYELGSLRYIACGKTEILRMIYPAVRDGQWATLPFTIQDEKLLEEKDSFSIEYTAVYGQHDIVFKAVYSITGSADNSIIFSMKGEVLERFEKNRIGLCVLHPIKECSGQVATITSADGSVYDGLFPVDISPHQPFLEVSAMNWSTITGINVRLHFQGDIFETEDQRNWSDASFKTYSTPQRIPFPVWVQKADTMEQVVTLKISGKANEDKKPATRPPIEEKIPFPLIGYCKSPHEADLTPQEIEYLSKIPFHHYRVAVKLYEDGWKTILDKALKEAALLSVQLELQVSFSPDAGEEIKELLTILQQSHQYIFSILPLQKDNATTPAELLELLYPSIKKTAPGILVGYGTDGHFVNVNRQRPVQINFDFVTIHLHPQAHATDLRTVFENLENQPDIIQTINNFAPGKPVHISPVTLKNNYDASGADARQYSHGMASWALLSLQQLSAAKTISLFEVSGPAGLLRTGKAGVELSAIYKVLSQIHTFQPVWIIKRNSDENILPGGLLLENKLGERLFFKMPHELNHFKQQKKMI